MAQGWTKCQSIRFYIQQEGQGEPIIMASSYKLYETCYTCVTSFTGEAKSCGTQREAVYTFTTDKDLSNIKIQGGLTNFTGADAVISITGGNLTATQSTVGGSSNRVIKIEGGVNACEKVTMNIKWNSTNSGGIITGNWSIKGSDGIDIAPAVEGLECH